MSDLLNLVVELDERFAAMPQAGCELVVSPRGELDESTLAWIDETFGGTWSSEAHAGANVVAVRAGLPVGFATYDAAGFAFAWLRGIAREPGVGVFGPIGVAPQERNGGLGAALLLAALAQLRARGYARALVAAAGRTLVPWYERLAGARVVERFDPAAMPRARAVVLASGSGTNFQAVLDRSQRGDLALDVVALIANQPQAYALERARAARVPSVMMLPWKRAERTREDYDAQLLEAVALERPDLVLLLGWMHLLAEPFVRTFPGLLNIHPAFLPLDPARDDVVAPDGARIAAFRGARAVRDAIAAGSPWTGATLHAVTPQTDRGPVLARRPMRLSPTDDEETALARLHPLEHEVVAAGIRRWLFER